MDTKSPSSLLSGQHVGHRTLLLRYVWPRWPLAAVVAVLLAARIALQLASPQVLRSYVDAALAGAPLGALLPAVLLFGGAALAQQAVAVGAVYATEWLGWTATNALRHDLVLHCLRLDLAFHYARTPGVLIERADGDVRRLAGFFSQFVVDIVGSLVLLTGILVVLWLEDWRYGAAFAASTLAGAAAYGRVVRIPQRYWVAERGASAAFLGFVEERLAGAEDIRANGAVPYVMRALLPHLRALLERSRRAWVMSGALNIAWQFYRALTFASGFGVGWWLHAQGAISPGTVYLAAWYFELATWPVMIITEKLEDLQRSGASVQRIRELLGQRSHLTPPAAPRSLPSSALSAELDGVTFRYPRLPRLPGIAGLPDTDVPPAADEAGDPVEPAGRGEDAPATALESVSFRLEPGRILGLLGRTGSGKSTISRLLFRFYDPQAGSVRLGDVDLRNVPLDQLRGRVGHVTQEVQLFHATVRQNLTFFRDDVADAEIQRAIGELGLEDWLRSLPRGLDTVIEPGGRSGAAPEGGHTGLSAGESQLVALARVFLRRPDLIVLDEASSRLDPATERRLDHALARLLAGRTAIVIAHRLDTIRRADDVLVLERGRVHEHGRRADLAADPRSRFSQLLATGLTEIHETGATGQPHAEVTA